MPSLVIKHYLMLHRTSFPCKHTAVSKRILKIQMAVQESAILAGSSAIKQQIGPTIVGPTTQRRLDNSVHAGLWNKHAAVVLHY